MKKLCILSALILSIQVSGETRWQTTHQTGNVYYGSNGLCELVSNSFRVKVNKLCLEVEEEAEIRTTGAVYNGDPSTLEITGNFRVSAGSAVRSMLLWNGDKILKAKLRDRTAADSAYEQVVQRDKATYVRRDPALIEYNGNNTYTYKIYPVEINNSRKIRLSYTVPLSCTDSSPHYELSPAFTMGSYKTPKNITIDFLNSDTTDSKYYLSLQDGTRKLIDFESTYQLSYTNLTKNSYWYNLSSPIIISIFPGNTTWNQAFSYKIDSGESKGNYTSVITSIPDTLKKMIKELALYNYSIDTKLSTTDKSYTTTLPAGGTFGLYLKTKDEWDRKLTWRVYNKSGDLVILYTQQFQEDYLSGYCSMVPFLWGTRYSLIENNGDLGAIFGFVDSKMSLLALESDALPSEIASQYQARGVPQLLPEDIIVDPSKIPPTPVENIIIDYTAVSLKQILSTGLRLFLLNNNIFVSLLNNNEPSTIDLDIFDLHGRLIYSKYALRISGNVSQLNIPLRLKGTFIVKIRSKSSTLQQKVILK